MLPEPTPSPSEAGQPDGSQGSGQATPEVLSALTRLLQAHIQVLVDQEVSVAARLQATEAELQLAAASPGSESDSPLCGQGAAGKAGVPPRLSQHGSPPAAASGDGVGGSGLLQCVAALEVAAQQAVQGCRAMRQAVASSTAQLRAAEEQVVQGQAGQYAAQAQLHALQARLQQALEAAAQERAQLGSQAAGQQAQLGAQLAASQQQAAALQAQLKTEAQVA
ncbi:hypothetical protein V8C86DRAFT_1017439 [Haematococcus lacustris]